MIHIINRHCGFSNLCPDINRPANFSRQKCFLNLVSTLGYDKDFKHHILFDGDMTGHFLKEYFCLDNLVMLKSGSGAKSFVDSVEYAISISKEGDYIYFLEDDYLHRPGWTNALKEGITLGEDIYFTLCDHPDKYPETIEAENKNVYMSMFGNLQSKIKVTPSCHWRTTTSTTDTFCISRKNLVKFKQAMVYFSSQFHYSLDYQRSLYLGEQGLTVWSCIPGYSSHMVKNYLSPVIDWEKVC